MKKTTQGFTLIELLVVIAIIGILSSIVIASLNSARTKGAVSAAKGQLAQIRTQAEVYYDAAGNANTYGPTTAAGAITTAACTAFTATSTNGMLADSIIKQQLTQIGTNVNAITGCSVGAQAWAVSVTLKDTTQWCVDNQGFSGPGATSATAAKCS